MSSADFSVLSEKLDDIASAIAKLKASEDATNLAKLDAEQARRSEVESQEMWLAYQEKAVEAALMAWDLLREVTIQDKDASIEFSRRRSKFLQFCREHVWADHEDPYYNPNEHS